MGRSAGMWGRRPRKRHRASPARIAILGSETDDVVLDSRVGQGVELSAPARWRMCPPISLA